MYFDNISKILSWCIPHVLLQCYATWMRRWPKCRPLQISSHFNYKDQSVTFTLKPFCSLRLLTYLRENDLYFEKVAHPCPSTKMSQGYKPSKFTNIYVTRGEYIFTKSVVLVATSGICIQPAYCFGFASQGMKYVVDRQGMVHKP